MSQPLSAPSSYPERAWHRYVTQGNCVIHIQFLSPPPPFTALILPDIAVQDSDEEQIGAWQPVRCPKSLKAPQRRDPRRAFEAVPLTSMPLNGAPSLYIRATAVTGIVMLLLQTPSTDASDAPMHALHVRLCAIGALCWNWSYCRMEVTMTVSSAIAWDG